MEVVVDGIKTHYEQLGEGEYVFILHGWGCKGETYLSIANILKRDYCVIIPDFPGFGQTNEPPFGWDTADYMEFFVKFVQSFKCRSASFIGHSFGSRILIRMATRGELPFAIEKMVFIDGAGILSNRIDEYLEGFRAFQKEKKRLIDRGDRTGLERLRMLVDVDYAYLSDTMCYCYYNTVTENLTELLPRINVPTLLIWGDQDRDTPIEDGKTMERLIPDSGLVTLEGAGHYSFLDQPFIFKRVIESFFDIH